MLLQIAHATQVLFARYVSVGQMMGLGVGVGVGARVEEVPTTRVDVGTGVGARVELNAKDEDGVGVGTRVWLKKTLELGTGVADTAAVLVAAGVVVAEEVTA